MHATFKKKKKFHTKLFKLSQTKRLQRELCPVWEINYTSHPFLEKKHLICAQRLLTHVGTNRSRLAIQLFYTKCHHTGTFPAVRGLQHPLVVAVIWRHPLPAKAVRGEIPVPLLLRGHCRRLSGHKIIFLNDKISVVIFPFDRIFCFLLVSIPPALQLVPE